MLTNLISRIIFIMNNNGLLMLQRYHSLRNSFDFVVKAILIDGKCRVWKVDTYYASTHARALTSVHTHTCACKSHKMSVTSQTFFSISFYNTCH